MTRRTLTLALVALGYFLFAQQVSAASLGVSPSSVSMRVGETKTVSLTVSSSDQALNASQARVSFPTDKLQVVGVSKSGLFSYWTQEPSYSNSSGTISFGGGLPTPGYTGGARAILSVTLRAKAEGTATLRYSSGVVLANDGEGTNILSGYSSATIRVSAAASPTPTPATPASPSTPAPTIRSSTHPDQNAWYSTPNIQFTWTRPSGFLGASYAFDQNAATVPDDALEQDTGSAQFSQTADGVWYFHVRAKYAAGWSSTAHFRVQVDTQPPASFTPQVTQEGGARNPAATIRFHTTDEGSGGVTYALSMDTGAFAPATSPTTVQQTRAGLHQFTIRATDRAGNSRDAVGEFTVEGSPAPRLTRVPTDVALFAEIVVEGLSLGTDTVILTIDGREVGRFAASDARIQPSPTLAIPDELTLWQFRASPFLAPGYHELSARAVNEYGIESPASVPVSFQTLGDTVRIFGIFLPTYPVLGGLVVVIFILAAALLILYERYRHWRRAESFNLDQAESEINAEIERLQSTLEKDIVGAIRTAVTERSMQAATHEEIRRDIAQTRQRIDDLIDKQLKKVKRRRAARK